MTRTIYPIDNTNFSAAFEGTSEILAGSAEDVGFTLTDLQGNPAVPLSLSYRILCSTTGTVVRDTTTLAPTAAGSVPLAPADTAMVLPGNPVEDRRIVLTASYGATDVLVTTYDFRVVNAG